MRVSHTLEPVFDDPNLIAYGGLPAVMSLAEQAGLSDLVAEHVTVPGTAGANTPTKVSAIIAGLVVGADSISDLDVLRHGGIGRVFTGLRAPTTLGTHLREYRFGHVRQLDAVAARLLVNLAQHTPILAGADQVVYLDVDDTIRETHGYHKQGAAYGYSRVKGLNAQVAVLSTPISAPVIAATRLRKGNIDSGHGAARLIADSLATLRRATTPGMVIVRADSAYFRHDVIAAATTGGAKFSVTAPAPPPRLALGTPTQRAPHRSARTTSRGRCHLTTAPTGTTTRNLRVETPGTPATLPRPHPEITRQPIQKQRNPYSLIRVGGSRLSRPWPRAATRGGG